MTTHDCTEPAVAFSGDGRMPLLGFSTWQISDGEAPEYITVAPEVGYRDIGATTGDGRAERDRRPGLIPDRHTKEVHRCPPSCI